MGCDIHCYIEYSSGKIHNEALYWRSFGGRINPGRNYLMFAKLAGIDCESFGISPVIRSPRGKPLDMGYSAKNDDVISVSDPPELPQPGECTRERAEYYINSCGSKYANESKTLVTHPDWHSHTWLTADELEAAINAPDIAKYELQVKAKKSKDIEDLAKQYPDMADKIKGRFNPSHGESLVDPGYWAILGAMRAFEKAGCIVRLVMWFDN